jgi:hypothetical protein
MKKVVDGEFWYVCARCGREWKLHTVDTNHARRQAGGISIFQCGCGRKKKMFWGK